MGGVGACGSYFRVTGGQAGGVEAVPTHALFAEDCGGWGVFSGVDPLGSKCLLLVQWHRIVNRTGYYILCQQCLSHPGALVTQQCVLMETVITIIRNPGGRESAACHRLEGTVLSP